MTTTRLHHRPRFGRVVYPDGTAEVVTFRQIGPWHYAVVDAATEELAPVCLHEGGWLDVDCATARDVLLIMTCEGRLASVVAGKVAGFTGFCGNPDHMGS